MHRVPNLSSFPLSCLSSLRLTRWSWRRLALVAVGGVAGLAARGQFVDLGNSIDDAAALGEGETFSFLTQQGLALDGAGRVAFTVYRGGGDYVVFLADGTAPLERAYGSGDAGVGGPLGAVYGPQFVSGGILFSQEHPVSANGTYFWNEGAGVHTPLLVEGGAVPGGGTFVYTQHSSVGAGGRRVAQSDTSAGNRLLWAVSTGGVQAVLQVFTPETESFFTGAGWAPSAAANADGDLAFTALDVPGYVGGLWRDTGSGLQRLATAGVTVVDGFTLSNPAVTNGSSATQPILIDAAGRVTFLSEVAGAPGGAVGLFSAGLDGTLAAILAPGMTPTERGVVSTVDAFAVADNGDLAVVATDVGGEALYSYTDGALQYLLGEGDALFGSTVTGLFGVARNDAGQIAFTYWLANGQWGVALHGTASAVPEPSTWATLAALVAFGLTLVRRRPRADPN